MSAWWNSLSLVSQIFACVAIPATVVLVIQTVLMLIGIGSDTGDGMDGLHLSDAHFDDFADGVHADTPGIFGDDIPGGDHDPSGLDGLRILSVRGIIAFLVVFGWVGLALDASGAAVWLSSVIAAVCGFGMMLLLAVLTRAVMRLRSEGNIDNRNALGVAGKVYLTVPPARTGEGKVNIMLQGSYVEREAVTDETEPIPNGCEVVVTALSGQTTLVVKRK